MNIKVSYTPHPNQKIIHDDNSRYKVVVAGRRFGKSLFARWHTILNAIHTPGRYWIVSPTITQGKSNHWTDPESNILIDTQDFRTYENSQDLAVEIPTLSGGKSRIELKGIENLEKVRGAGLQGAVLDEAAFLTEYSWSGVIRPMTLTGKGWAVFIGTPFGKNWFKELYDQGAIHTEVEKIDKGDYPIWKAKKVKGKPSAKIYKDWSSYRFTSYDNPLNDPDDIELIRQDHIKKKALDLFSQEYLADFKKVTGLVYPLFERNMHVIDPFEIPMDWDIYRGVDFGYGVNPTVCLWIAVSPDDKWYVIDEYYETKDASDYHTGMILSKSAEYQQATNSFGDPSNPMLIQEWGKKGVYLTPAKRETGTNLRDWVATGIDIITEKMKPRTIDNKPNLFVFKDCIHLISELEQYMWEDKKEDQNHTARPKKLNDHGPDALRYFAISYSQGFKKRGDYRVYAQKNKEIKDSVLGI